MHCMTIFISGAEPLHLCFSDQEAAQSGLLELDRAISVAPRGGLITVRDETYQVAFLKRDFRTLILTSSDDDDGDAEPQNVPTDDATAPLGIPTTDLSQGPCLSMEADLAAIVHDARSRDKVTFDPKPTLTMEAHNVK